MFIYVIKAKPTAKSKYSKDIAGAYVNCWIDFKDSRAGQRLAEMLIEDADWTVLSKRPGRWEYKTLRDVLPEERQYYREAKESGSSLVFNMWPLRKRKRRKK